MNVDFLMVSFLYFSNYSFQNCVLTLINQLLGSAVSEIRQFQAVPFPAPPFPSYSLNLLLESVPFSEVLF